MNLFIRRVGSLLLVVVGLVIITFTITYAIPADPARMAVGLEAGPEQVEAYRKKMGLDQPVHIQFWRYISNLAQGDFGRSIATRRPVIEDLKLFFPASAELAIFGMLLYVIVGIPLGVLAALQHESLLDYVIRFITVLGLAIPNFVLALLLQLVLSRTLGWFPIDGRLDLNLTPPERMTGFLTLDSIFTGNWTTLWDSLEHMVLPMISIAAGRFAVAARFMRSGLLDVMREDYIRTARSKGLYERLVVGRHALKNAVIPLITVLGLQFGFLLGGIILVEIVFNWPGLGRYVVTSIFAFDFPAVMGATILMGTIYVVVNFFVDLSYRYLDPRITE